MIVSGTTGPALLPESSGQPRSDPGFRGSSLAIVCASTKQTLAKTREQKHEAVVALNDVPD
jgi:hypothetical protein